MYNVCKKYNNAAWLQNGEGFYTNEEQEWDYARMIVYTKFKTLWEIGSLCPIIWYKSCYPNVGNLGWRS